MWLAMCLADILYNKHFYKQNKFKFKISPIDSNFIKFKNMKNKINKVKPHAKLRMCKLNIIKMLKRFSYLN